MKRDLLSRRDRRDTALGALDATVPLEPVATTPVVLLIHDTAGARSALTFLLADEGFEVLAVATDQDVLAAIRRHQPAVILLHAVTAHERALELVGQIRREGDEPLLVLSPRGSTEDRVRGLELGADDYLPTPFDPDELTARVRAVLRRGERSTSLVPPMIVGELVIDFDRRILTRAGKVISLGRTEWLVLRHLARYPGKVVLNTELLSAIWGDGYADDLQVLRICISRLRHKLGASRRGGGPIKTFHNVGYALDDG